MRSRFVALMAVCGTVALVGWDTPRLGFDPSATEDTATPVSDPDSTGSVNPLSAGTRHFDAAPATAMTSPGEAAAADPDPTEHASIPAGASAAETPVVEASLLESRDVTPSSAGTRPFDAAPATAMSSPGEAATAEPGSTEHASIRADAPAAETPVIEAPLIDPDRVRPPEKPVRLVSAFPSSAAIDYPKPAARPLETPKECLLAEICIDDYLWSLYERTPKFDTNKVTERIKKTVKKKGKLRTVMTTIVKYVVGDFTWKDPIAAQKAGMSVKDYVIGGMDRGFKLKLYRALRAVEDAGFMPGITSAFRDDYRQAIASGNKAASDSSYHGGSRRGGYGHGLAADLVSLKGETRMERYAASDELWKWIDANEKELGIGRPYRDRDPPHVGPIDGKEFAVKRALANVQKAAKTKRAQAAKLQTKKPATTARANPATTKRASPEKPSKVSSLQTRAAVQR